MHMNEYGMRKNVSGAFTDVAQQVREALAQEGFGVLFQIDVQKTLKEKLGVEHPAYVILGACHPQSAHRALQAEKEIGLLLPCNVIVYEDGGAITISVIRPTVALPTSGNPVLRELAKEIEEKLVRVLNAVR